MKGFKAKTQKERKKESVRHPDYCSNPEAKAPVAGCGLCSQHGFEFMSVLYFTGRTKNRSPTDSVIFGVFLGFFFLHCFKYCFCLKLSPGYSPLILDTLTG